jgi:hypothetical protein
MRVNPHEALSDDAFRAILSACRDLGETEQGGLTPFHGPCIARGLAATGRMTAESARANIERWAQALGGKIDGDVIWLPTSNAPPPPPTPDDD